MSAKSKRSWQQKRPARRTSKPIKTEARKRSEDELDRPFPPALLKQARAAALEYQIVLTNEEGHWYGRGLELPLVFGDGVTPAKCIDDTRAAMTAAVAYLIEHGQRPPPPARSGTRTQQVNVRLTAEEKAMLEATARRKGFEGLSDFLRAAALESAT